MDLSRPNADPYTIPRPCGAGYAEYWPLPKSFNPFRYQTLYEGPAFTSDTKYVKGNNGQYYRGQNLLYSASAARNNIPMSILKALDNNQGEKKLDRLKVWKPDSRVNTTNVDGETPVAVIVMTASEHDPSLTEISEPQMPETDPVELDRRASVELKKYKFKIGKSDPGTAVKEEETGGGEEKDGEKDG
ncbi:hypothetical protein EGW08_017822, partial [Elysia chlorotica]